MKLSLSYLKGIVSIYFLINTLLISSLPLFAQQSLGDYLVPQLTDWNYDSGKSTGDFYVFQNLSKKNEVALKKEPIDCPNLQEFNKFIITEIQNLQKEQWIIEQRKPMAPYAFAGIKTCNFMKLKPKSGGQSKFVLHYLVNAKIYQVEIFSETLLNIPPLEATDFIAQISTTESKSTFVKKQDIQQAVTTTDPNVLVSKEEPESATTDNLSGFKKVKTQPPAPPAKPTGNPAQKANAGGTAATSGTTGSGTSTASNSSTTSSQPVSGSSSISGNPQIDKGNMPLVKFSVTDPCEGGGNTDGLPWQQKSATSKIEILKGVDVAQTPILPNLKSMSDVSYNSAVSATFEAMRLVYGPLSADETKKFEAAWVPLFDFPSQNVIDYLNKLNPLVSQFLACRESYVRSLADIQGVLLDASIAVELKDQYAWESAMASAGMSVQILKPLDAAMKQLAQQIEALGNPPNPAEEKCTARNRYKKALGQPRPDYPFEGVWVGENDRRSIIKVAYAFDDGKALVYIYPESQLKTLADQGFDINKVGMQTVEGKGMGLIPGMSDLLWIYEEIYPDVWISLEWSFLQTISAYSIKGNQMTTTTYTPPTVLTVTSSSGKSEAQRTNESFENPPVLHYEGAPKDWNDLINMIIKEKWYQQKYDSYMDWRRSDDSEKSIAAAIEGPTERRKRIQEYEQKRNRIDSYYTDPNDKAKEIAKLDAEYADALGTSATPPKPQQTTEKTQQADVNKSKEEAARLEQDKKDAIAFHSEMVQVISKNLDREIADRDNAIKAMSQAKTQKEAEMQGERIKEFNLRIINIQSQIQSEQDLVTSYQTGQVVHTRTVFDEYAHQKMIHDMKENAARVDATRRIA